MMNPEFPLQQCLMASPAQKGTLALISENWMENKNQNWFCANKYSSLFFQKVWVRCSNPASLELVLISPWGTSENMSLKISLTKILWYAEKQVRYHDFIEKTVARTNIFRDLVNWLLLMSSLLKCCKPFWGLYSSSSFTVVVSCIPYAWLRNMRMSSIWPEVLHKSMRLPCSQLYWRK